MPTACVVAERKQGSKASHGRNHRGLVGWVSVYVHTVKCLIAKLVYSSDYTDGSRVILLIFLPCFAPLRL